MQLFLAEYAFLSIFALRKREKMFRNKHSERLKENNQRESSSVGRARPCQGRGREFESRLSLKSLPQEGIYC
jgi:hypothetical protein